MHEENVRLELRIDSGPGATAEQTDRQVRSLYGNLRTLGLLRVERGTVAAPEESMAGVGHDLAVLVVSGAFSAAALKALSNVVVAFVQRSKARSVEWEIDGHKGSFDALSAKDQQALVEAVTARIQAGTAAVASAPADSGTGVATGPNTNSDPGVGDGGTPDRTARRD
ncbi:hypothetical protein OG241_43300 [Streptomyces sp. NBC_01390]|uniref:effector-associated constant component EACC1 n=1 Tax=Streptomyces sp. NBC_01390 TaxID=2903850 RepID=UPI003244155C